MNNQKDCIPKILETADITGWYDNINHADLKEKIEAIIVATYKNRRRKYINIKNK